MAKTIAQVASRTGRISLSVPANGLVKEKIQRPQSLAKTTATANSTISRAKLLGKQESPQAKWVNTIPTHPTTTTRGGNTTTSRKSDCGPANFNHKDVNGRAKDGCADDGRPAEEEAQREVVGADECNKQMENGGHDEVVARESKQDEVFGQDAIRHVNLQRTKQAEATSGSVESANSTSQAFNSQQQDGGFQDLSLLSSKTVAGTSDTVVGPSLDNQNQMSGGDVSRAHSAKYGQPITVPGHKKRELKRPEPANVNANKHGALSHYSDEEDDDYKKQHEKTKRPTNNLQIPSHTYLIKSSTEIVNKYQQQGGSLREPLSNCCKSQQRQNTSTHLKLTKLPAARINCKNNANANAAAVTAEEPAIIGDGAFKKDEASKSSKVNGHIRQKPMGQKVLSLMMLDAGLCPAGGVSQPVTNIKNSHVCLQNERDIDCDTDCERSFSGLCEPLASCLVEDERKKRLLEIYDHLRASNISDGNRLGLVNRCQPLSVSCSAEQSYDDNHERHLVTVRSQAADKPKPKRNLVSENNQNFRSISLPSSPRLTRLRANNGWLKANEEAQLQALYRHAGTQRHRDDKQSHKVQVDSDFPRLSCNEKLHGSIASWLSPVQSQKPELAIADLRNSTLPYQFSCYSQIDNQSAASSSCSSLHHQCPPVLTLSNQLDGPEIRKLIRASGKDLSGQRKSNDEAQRTSSETGENLGTDSCTNVSTQLISNNNELQSSALLAAQVTWQHEKLLTDPKSKTRARDNSSKEIDHHLRACRGSDGGTHLGLSASVVSLEESDGVFRTETRFSGGSSGERANQNHFSSTRRSSEDEGCGLDKASTKYLCAEKNNESLLELQLRLVTVSLSLSHHSLTSSSLVHHRCFFYHTFAYYFFRLSSLKRRRFPVCGQLRGGQ